MSQDPTAPATEGQSFLILNAGSSTFKWTLLARDESVLDSGAESWSSSEREKGSGKIEAVLRKIPRCAAVGHRVVHGGQEFHRTVLLDAAVRAKLEALLPIDPLHMQPALWGMQATSEAFPGIPQYAAFDTAFHATLSEAAAGYGIPRAWEQDWGLRRFGFHGLSVAYSVERARQMLGRLPHRIVVCHLGSGCSVTAVREGRSVDTTMGFTPLEGLLMGTRSGSVDPGLLLHLLTFRKIPAPQLADVLNERSGLLGVSGVSADMRQVIQAADSGSAAAKLAYDRFILFARRAVGGMTGTLGGIDLLVFTGGIGEHSPRIRRDISLAVTEENPFIDADRNETAASDAEISVAQGRPRALVISAREDLMILRDMIAHFTL